MQLAEGTGGKGGSSRPWYAAASPAKQVEPAKKKQASCEFGTFWSRSAPACCWRRIYSNAVRNRQGCGILLRAPTEFPPLSSQRNLPRFGTPPTRGKQAHRSRRLQNQVRKKGSLN